MNNIDVIKSFLYGSSTKIHSLNLFMSGDGCKLCHDNTCMAQFHNGRLYINTTYYNRTKRKIRNMIADEAKKYIKHACIQYIDNIQVGCSALIKDEEK